MAGSSRQYYWDSALPGTVGFSPGFNSSGDTYTYQYYGSSYPFPNWEPIVPTDAFSHYAGGTSDVYDSLGSKVASLTAKIYVQ